MGNFEIIDSHLHVFDLNVKANFPNQNRSHEFPNQEPIVRNISQEYAKEIANKSGVKKVVFVMCYDDCPEEAQWVYDNAQKTGNGKFVIKNVFLNCYYHYAAIAKLRTTFFFKNLT